MFDYYCIIAVRNGEKTIDPTLNSLLDQSIPPKKIVIVNDGSTDHTKTILKNFSRSFPEIFEIFSTQNTKIDYSRIPSLWNVCLRRDYDFCLISGGDCVFEKEYAEKNLEQMKKDNKLVVCSGNFGNHKGDTPRGAGRFIRQSFFFNHYEKHYEKVGYESELLENAQFLGYRIKIINDAKFEHIDKLGHGHKFVEFGMAMKSLGYYPPYAFGRFLKCLVTGEEIGRKGSLQMIWAYLTFKPTKNGYYSMFPKKFRDQVSAKQKRLMKMKFKKLF